MVFSCLRSKRRNKLQSKTTDCQLEQSFQNNTNVDNFTSSHCKEKGSNFTFISNNTCLQDNENLNNIQTPTTFQQEKQIFDREYLSFGFISRQQYNNFLDYATQNGIEITIAQAAQFRKERKVKKHILLNFIMKELERKSYEKDWVLESQSNKNYLEIMEEYIEAKREYFALRRKLEQYMPLGNN